MQENDSRLRMTGLNKGGRRRFDEGDKRALVEACLRPGVSVAKMAQTAGVNANLLRKWIARYLLDRERAGASQILDAVPSMAALSTTVEASVTAFVPATLSMATLPTEAAPALIAHALHVQLPNGVQFDLDKASIEELTTIIQMLGRLPCSGSTTR
jgi:transposase